MMMRVEPTETDLVGDQIRLGLYLSAQHPPGVPAADAVRDHLEKSSSLAILSSRRYGPPSNSHPFQMFQTVPLLPR